MWKGYGVTEDGIFRQSGSTTGSSGGSAQSPPKHEALKFYGSIVIFIIILLSLAYVVDIVFFPTSGEYREGVVFGSLSYVETDDSCGAWLYCYTYLEFYNQSSWWFGNPVNFVHTLDLGKVYGFYYDSVEMPAGIMGNPDYWDLNLYKIVDCENNVLWEKK